MLKVLILDDIDPISKEILEREPGFQADISPTLSLAQLIERVGDYEALMVRSQTKVTAEVIRAGKSLKVIGRAGVGVDNIALDAATKQGIIVLNSPAGNTTAAAEHTIALMLALARRIPMADRALKEGQWLRGEFLGVEVYHKTLSIVGLGKIGSRVAALARTLGMQVLAVDPYVSPEMARDLGVELVDLDTALRRADFLTFHIHKTRDTHHLLNRERLAMMKPTARVINCARGGIIDEGALVEALQAGKLAGAALDVFEEEPLTASPLQNLADRVIITPHLGASTAEAQRNVAIDVAEQIRAVLRGEGASGAVNIPSLRPEVLEPARPYLPLAEKIGSLAVQLCQGAISRIAIDYRGLLAERHPEALTPAILKGILGHQLWEGVNFVNAPVIARERGIRVVESRSTEVTDFSNLIMLEIQAEGGKVIVGGSLVGEKDPRLVNIGGFHINAELTGNLLLISHQDRPGMIGKVGTILGENNINIASMEVGRQYPRGPAVMVLTVDEPIPDAVAEQIKRVVGLDTVQVASL